MSRRGSAQLLLLLSRPCHRLGRAMAALAGAIIAVGLVWSGLGFSSLAPSELAQLVRQSTWDRALTESAEHTPWPWDTTQTLIAADVPRLGLSASVVHDGWSDGRYAAEVEPWTQDAAALSMMAIGDRITLTTAKGASRVYRVTGRKMVDPHLAENGVPALGGDAALVTCPAQNSASTLQLVIQGTTTDLPSVEPKEEQKL
jgi:hypothetical protein